MRARTLGLTTALTLLALMAGPGSAQTIAELPRLSGLSGPCSAVSP